MKNSAASVRQRLLNLSRKRREDFNFVLTQYVIQRLLYRLSVSDYKDQFLLKGAMLFLVWTGDLHRPTKDVDLLGFGQNDVDILVADFKIICGLDTDDGLVFDEGSIKGIQIKEDALYQGVRVTGFAYLEKARVSFQVDIGFGDAVTPKAELATIPSFLDLPDPVIRTYPVYTVIAEKFQAMIALGIANSRIKDFYDIWVIASGMALDGQLLVDAVSVTFTQRDSVCDDRPLTIFSDEFIQNGNKQKQWAAFLNKNRLQSDMSFPELMGQLQAMLEPVYLTVAHEQKFSYKWNSAQWKWLGFSESKIGLGAGF